MILSILHTCVWLFRLNFGPTRFFYVSIFVLYFLRVFLYCIFHLYHLPVFFIYFFYLYFLSFLFIFFRNDGSDSRVAEVSALLKLRWEGVRVCVKERQRGCLIERECVCACACGCGCGCAWQRERRKERPMERKW